MLYNYVVRIFNLYVKKVQCLTVPFFLTPFARGQKIDF